MKSKPKITCVRKAGKDHQVITVEGGTRGAYCKEPCATCPFRVDAVGIFPPSAFRHSANVAEDMSGETFACHSLGAESPAICAGFLLVASAHNLAVRLMLMRGEIEVDKVSDGGHELHESYRAMAIANGVKRNDPALRNCRD